MRLENLISPIAQTRKHRVFDSSVSGLEGASRLLAEISGRGQPVRLSQNTYRTEPGTRLRHVRLCKRPQEAVSAIDRTVEEGIRRVAADRAAVLEGRPP